MKDGLLALFLFLVSALISWLLVKRVKVLDVPNARSSHGSSTPTLGGIAIVGTFLLGMVLNYFFDASPLVTSKFYLGLSLSTLVLAGVSLLDDIKDLPFTIRLAAQALAAGIAIASGITLPGVFGTVITFFWILGMVNAVNFMDGLNGMTGGTSVIAALYFIVISLNLGGSGHIPACFLGAGTLGFLMFNFPKGRLFMGDVGSTFLGFSFAALAVIANVKDGSHIPLMVIPLLFFHFIYDTSFTLIRRFRRGENIFTAHKTHLYQLFNQLGYSHAAVTGVYCTMAALQGLGALWLIHIRAPLNLTVFIPFLGLQAAFTRLVIPKARKKGLLQ